ncbi:MAG: hypothetical protein AABY22_34685 [Nanoarchaeota archaeon]
MKYSKKQIREMQRLRKKTTLVKTAQTLKVPVATVRYHTDENCRQRTIGFQTQWRLKNIEKFRKYQRE